MEIDFTKTNYEKPAGQGKKSRDAFVSVMIFVFILIFGAAGYLFFQRYSLQQEKAKLEASITSITNNIKLLTNTDNPAQKILVAKKINKIKKNQTLWSEVMAKIIKLETPGIKFRDFSVDKKGKTTATIATSTFESLNQFIAKLNENPEINDIVVRSITNENEQDALFNGLKIDLNFTIKK